MADVLYSLRSNADGSQHTKYPDGDKGGVLAAPDSLVSSSETANAIDLNWNYNGSGHDGFEIQQRIVGISDSWTTVGVQGPSARFWHAGGLPGSAHIGHRVRATSGAVVSAWSGQSWTDTLTPEGGVTDLSQIYKAWNFNNQADDTALADVPDIWTGNSDRTALIVSDVLHNGNKSAKCIIPTDKGGDGVNQFGYWGMGHELAAPLKEGDEIWMRFSEKLDPAWVWEGGGATGGQTADKWMRLRRDHSLGGNSGYTDTYFGHTDAHSDGYNWFTVEGAQIGPEDPWGPGGSGWTRVASPNAPTPFALNEWHTFEMYVYLRGEFIDDGKVLARCWVDGLWHGDVIATPNYPIRTLDGAVQSVSDALWHTIWRINVPEQYSWIADPAIAFRSARLGIDDTQHMAVDAHGFPYIGLA